MCIEKQSQITIELLSHKSSQMYPKEVDWTRSGTVMGKKNKASIKKRDQTQI